MGHISKIDLSTGWVCVQLALEPLWKLYEVCSPGADVKAVLSKAAKSLGLDQVIVFFVYLTALLKHR